MKKNIEKKNNVTKLLAGPAQESFLRLSSSQVDLCRTVRIKKTQVDVPPSEWLIIIIYNPGKG